jgi:MATE family multidrug resistance protein
MKKASYIDHFKKNLALALPVMTGQLGQIFSGVADTVMVGRVGESSIAAASLANGLFFFIFVIGIGISFAATPLVAEAHGKDNLRGICRWLKNSYWLNLMVAVVLGIIVFGVTFFMDHMNQPEEVVILARPYLYIIGLSIFPVMFFQTYKQFTEGMSDTKTAMYISLIGNTINIGLNYILIFGKLGVPPMGLIGAGIATLISRIFMAIAIYRYFNSTRRYSSVQVVLQKVLVSKQAILKLFKLGFPTGLQFSFEVSAFAGASVMAGWLSVQAMAAHQIALNLASISWMMATGLGAAATIRIGNHLGKKDYINLRRVGLSSYVLVTILMAIAGFLFWLFRYELAALYVTEPVVINLAAALLLIAVLFQISDGIQVIGLGLLRGLQDVNKPAIISFVAYWAIGIPIGYYLGFNMEMGIEGIWIGLLCGLTASAIMLGFRFALLSKGLIK